MYEVNGERAVKWERFDAIVSTQEYVKEKRAEGRDLIVTAKVQTGGKGTKGRSFVSGNGGIYLSKLSFYENFPGREAFKIMSGAAVAVCETLRVCGLSPVIKWPNDVFVNDRKICGILIENVFSGNKISSSLVGIGLNINNVLPAELSEIATTVKTETGKEWNTEALTERLIAELAVSRSMEEYLSYLGYLGREVTLIFGDERIPATLLSVDNEGGLLAQIHGETKRLTAAEVSVRL